jgi:hypothetical protein
LTGNSILISTIMKKVILLTGLMLVSGIRFISNAQAGGTDPDPGETVFIEHADDCLDIMEKAAQKISVAGVAVIAYLPGNVTASWISKMKVVGVLATDKDNFLGIANAKASEMAVSYKNSGTSQQKPRIGEFGWQGGMIRKVKSGYIVAAFSGGTGEQDADISDEALEWLSKYY